MAQTSPRAVRAVCSSQAEEDASPRRLKKRATDRRCQREARERTKSRIAYLESLVEELKYKDSSARVLALSQKLRQAEQERDAMARTLRALRTILDTQHLSCAPDHVLPETTVPKSSLWSSEANCGTQHITVSSQNVVLNMPNALTVVFGEAQHTSMQEGHSFSDTVRTSEALQRSGGSLPSQRRGLFQAPNETYQEHNLCTCNTHINRQAGHSSVWQGNYWRFACEVLEERFLWPESMEPASDTSTDDIPIRGLLEGWEVVRQKPMHPSWMILSRIDEVLFPSMAKAERLAILKAMHLLLQFHLQPSMQRFQRLPPWYIYRFSQGLPHTFAIDFFAWPGFRERFIFNEHAYCGNNFWHSLQRNLKLLWPYKFEDCFLRDADTDLFKTTPLFNERLMDINCWTMRSDFFGLFPELRSEIPEFVRVPRLLSQEHSQQECLRRSTTPSSHAEGVGSHDGQQVTSDAASKYDKSNDFRLHGRPINTARTHSCTKSSEACSHHHHDI